MTKTRDFQRKRVYDWEDRHVAPQDQSLVPFCDIQNIVNNCWPVEHPPRVQPLHKNSRYLGTGHRLRVRFPPDHPTPTWVILHELAHSLTHGDKHGPNFVGVYMQLVNRFLSIPLPKLFYTARESRVQYSVSPTYNLTGDY